MNSKNNLSLSKPVLIIVRLGNLMESLLLIIGGCAVVLFLTAVLIDVTARQLFRPIVWMQEFALLAYVWAIFTGAAIGIRRGTHFKIDIIVGHLKGLPHRIVEVFDHLVTLAFICVLTYYAAEYAGMSLHRFSQPSGICMVYFTSCMLVGGICMAYFCIEHFALLFSGTDIKSVCEQLKEAGK